MVTFKSLLSTEFDPVFLIQLGEPFGAASLDGTGNVPLSQLGNIPPAVTDHGGLSGLADDDHLQYALLTGRPNGQDFVGGTLLGDPLALTATIDVGGGPITFNSTVGTERARLTATGEFLINTLVPFGSEKFSVVGDARIDGKLTVTGAIDPTFIRLTSTLDDDVYVEWTDGQNVPVSNSNEGRIRYNTAMQRFERSQDGGAWGPFADPNAFVLDGNSFGGLATLGTNDTNALAFETDGSERARFLSTGEFVIGGTSVVSTEKFRLVGDARVEGNVLITGDATIEGTTTTINSTVVDIADRVIHVNNSTGVVAVPAFITGLNVHRGADVGPTTRDHASLLWDNDSNVIDPSTGTGYWRFSANTGGDDVTVGADLDVRVRMLMLSRTSGIGIRFETDNSATIGDVGANRPSIIYAGTSVVVGNTVTVTSNQVSSNTTLNLAASSDLIFETSGTERARFLSASATLRGNTGLTISGSNLPGSVLNSNGDLQLRGTSDVTPGYVAVTGSHSLLSSKIMGGKFASSSLTLKSGEDLSGGGGGTIDMYIGNTLTLRLEGVGRKILYNTATPFLGGVFDGVYNQNSASLICLANRDGGSGASAGVQLDAGSGMQGTILSRSSTQATFPSKLTFGTAVNMTGMAFHTNNSTDSIQFNVPTSTEICRITTNGLLVGQSTPSSLAARVDILRTTAGIALGVITSDLGGTPAYFQNTSASHAGVVALFYSAGTATVNMRMLSLARDVGTIGHRELIHFQGLHSGGSGASWAEMGVEVVDNGAGGPGFNVITRADFIFRAGNGGSNTHLDKIRLTGETTPAIQGTSGLVVRGGSSASNIIFQSAPTTERVRVQSTGELLVGATILLGSEFSLFRKDGVGTTYIRTYNATSGATSAAGFTATSSINANISAMSAGFTPTSGLEPNEAAFYTSGLGILSLLTQGAQPILFKTNTSERAQVTATGEFLIGTTSDVATLTVLQQDYVASPVSALYVEAGNLTALSSSTEHSAVIYLLGHYEFDSGDITTQRGFVIDAPIFDINGTGGTITNAATIAITGAPTPGTSTAFTNSYALWIQSGESRFDGDLIVDGKLTVTGAIDPTALYLDSQITAPANAAGKGVLFVKNVGGIEELHYRNNTGTEVQVSDDTGVAAPGASAFPLLAPNDTAGAPSYSWSTSPTTGIFRQAADSIGIATAGVERIRVNASGQVMFGTPANPDGISLQIFSSPTRPIILLSDRNAPGVGVKGDYQITAQRGDGLNEMVAMMQGHLDDYVNPTSWKGRMSLYTNRDGAGQEHIRLQATGEIIFKRTLPTAIEFARFLTTGELGIGTAIPAAKLHVTHSTGNVAVYVQGGSVGAGGYITFLDGDATIAGSIGHQGPLYGSGTNLVVAAGTGKNLYLQTSSGNNTIVRGNAASTGNHYLVLEGGGSGGHGALQVNATTGVVVGYLGSTGITLGSGTDFSIRSESGKALVFAIGAVDRGRFLSSGEFLVGRSTLFFASDVAEFSKVQNGVTRLTVLNNAGTAATSQMNATVDAATVPISVHATIISGGFTTSGINVAGEAQFGTNSSVGLLFRNESAAPIRFATSDTERIRISATGEMSIGKSTSTAATMKLQVFSSTGLVGMQAETTSTGTTAGAISRYINTLGIADVGVSGSGFTPTGGVSSNELFIAANSTLAGINVVTQGATYIRFGTASSERVRILSTGEFLIGHDVLISTERLLVRKDQDADTFIMVKNGQDGTTSSSSIRLSSTNNILRAGHTALSFATVNGIEANEAFVEGFSSNLVLAAQGSKSVRFITNGIDRGRFTAAGVLLVGTSSLEASEFALFYRNGDTPTQLRVSNPDTTSNANANIAVNCGGTGATQVQGFVNAIATGSTGEVQFGANGTGVTGIAIRNITSTPIRFLTADSERVKILSTGEVGIGTSTPQFLFDVAGGASNRVALPGPTSAPTDGNLDNAQWSAWIDEGSNLFTFRVKYSDGTLKTGTVTLT